MCVVLATQRVGVKAFCRSGSSSAWIMKLLEDARYVHRTYTTSWMPGWHVDCVVNHLNTDTTCCSNQHLLKFRSFNLFNVVVDDATLTKKDWIQKDYILTIIVYWDFVVQWKSQWSNFHTCDLQNMTLESPCIKPCIVTSSMYHKGFLSNE